MISCVYCGGAHARPAEVRRCWAEQQAGATRSGAPGSGSAPQAAALPAVDCRLRRGPAQLGRHVLVTPGAEAPPDWSGCPRLRIDAAALADPERVVVELRAATLAGWSRAIELDRGFDLTRAPAEVAQRPPYELGPGHTFWRDELHHLLTSNAVDARDPSRPRWGLLAAALALGARPLEPDAGVGDVVVSGEPAWLDGGPIRHHDPIDGAAVIHAIQVTNGRLAVAAANVTAEELAPDQLAAVVHPGGAARIIAPAGSGKTRVLTARARHLLVAWSVPPQALALVAFNKRAQQEISARTSDVPGLNVRTLNSIALAIINGTPPFARQPFQWRTIDEPQVRAILGRFVQSPRRANVDPLAPWIDALSLLRLGLVAPNAVEARYGGDVDGLTEVWPLYRDALERQRAVDFDDQIRRAIEVLLAQPDARAAAQAACRVLLVDEFQDLTPAHVLLVRLLTAAGGAVFGVGDDDQTIYGYNGADPGWLIDFDRWFPGAGDHPLEVNYRCPPDVVDVAARLLRHNRRRVPKVIRAGAPAGAVPGWLADGDPDAVGATIAAVTAAIEAGARPHEVAVLTRVNATLAPVQLALSRAGVPFTGGVGSDFVQHTAVRAALAWLRLSTATRFASADVDQALRRPSRSLHPRVREWVVEQRDVAGLSRLADRVTNDRDATRILEFAGDVTRLQTLAAGGASTPRLLDSLVDAIGLGGAVATLDGNRHGMNRPSQSDDLLALRQIARLHPDLDGFESWLAGGLATRRDPDGVVLATVHRVKGQEWPYVVLHMAAGDQFPHRLAEDEEEERRLFHVAVTRARRQVTIVTGDHPSPFVDELTTEPSAHPRRAVTAPMAAQPKAAPRRSGLERAAHPLLERDRVMAAVGLVLVDQGLEWTITAIEPAAAVAERNGATRRFALGEKVETAGRQRGPLRPRPGGVDEANVIAFDLLRGYRDRVRDGKPAYTVFDDKTLAALAMAMPTDLEQLASVKGIGPAKLEQYGDDVIELIAAALEPLGGRSEASAPGSAGER